MDDLGALWSLWGLADLRAQGTYCRSAVLPFGGPAQRPPPCTDTSDVEAGYLVCPCPPVSTAIVGLKARLVFNLVMIWSVSLLRVKLSKCDDK